MLMGKSKCQTVGHSCHLMVKGKPISGFLQIGCFESNDSLVCKQKKWIQAKAYLDKK